MKHDNEKLNSLAIEAKRGCKESLDKLCRYYLPKLEKISRNIWYRISNEASFECYCIRKIADAIEKFDPEKGSFDVQVKYRLKSAIALFITRGKKRQKPYSIDELMQNDVSDNDFTFEVKDDLAIVDSNVLTKEITALLARGDQKKELILSYWLNGFTNDTKLSELLAQQFGRKPRSYCRYIQRFREKSKLDLINIGYYSK